MDPPGLTKEQLAAIEARVATEIAAKLNNLGFTEAAAAAADSSRTNATSSKAQLQARVDPDSEAEWEDERDDDSDVLPELESQGEPDSDPDLPDLVAEDDAQKAVLTDELPDLEGSDEMPGLEGPSDASDSEGMPGLEEEEFVREPSSAQFYARQKQQQPERRGPSTSTNVRAAPQQIPKHNAPAATFKPAGTVDNAEGQQSKKKKKKSKGKKKSKETALKIVPNLAHLPEKVLDRIIEHLRVVCAPPRRPPGSEPRLLGPHLRKSPERLPGSLVERRLRAGLEFQQASAALSLTCRSLRLAGQRPLLHTLTFDSSTPMKEVRYFVSRIREGNPSICRLVRTVHYVVTGGLHQDAVIFSQLLKQCCNLVTLQVDASLLDRSIVDACPPVRDIGERSGPTVGKTIGRDKGRQEFAKVMALLHTSKQIPEVVISNFSLWQAGVLPPRPLRSLTFDFQVGPGATPFDLMRLMTPETGLLSAEHVTLRNIVCYKDSEKAAAGEYRSRLNLAFRNALAKESLQAGESGSAQDTFWLLNKPKSVSLERCRLSLPALQKFFDAPVATSLTTLHLHEIIQSLLPGLRAASKPKFAFDRLRNLQHLRLGTIGKGIIDGVPARLASVTFTVANCHEAQSWLEKAVRGKSGYSGMMRLPAKCIIKVCPRIALRKMDGPENVGDVEVPDSWKWIQKEAAGLDATLAKLRRKCIPMTFALALEEGARYFRSDIYRWLARRGEEEPSKGAKRNYMWGELAELSLDDEERFMLASEGEEEAESQTIQEAHTAGAKGAGAEVGKSRTDNHAELKEVTGAKGGELDQQHGNAGAPQENTQASEMVEATVEKDQEGGLPAAVDPDAPWSWSDEE